MSAVEIEDAKKEENFHFLKDRFSVMADPMDMNFDMFSETYVRLLKSITSQFLSRYSKIYNKCQKLLKTQRPLTKYGPRWCCQFICT